MNEVKSLDINLIQSNPYQPRNHFDQQAIQQLAESINQYGLLQPITVRQTSDGYQLIAGERRLKATKLLNKQFIDAIILDKNDLQSAQLALLENIQREDLSAIEEASAYLNILRMNSLTQEELADKVGKSQASIANKIRLLNLNQQVKDAINQKKLTERHGRALLMLNDNDQLDVLKVILKKNLNVTETEKYIDSHYINVKKKKHIRCFGANEKLCIDTLTQTYNDMTKLGLNVKMTKQENENEVIVSFSIKK